MEEEIIKFETAKLAKEKGFDIRMHWESYGYVEDGTKYWSLAVPLAKTNMEQFKAPTQSFLQKWLREQHGIYVLVRRGYGWEWYIEGENKGDGTYNSYEEALEEGLVRGLHMIMDNENKKEK